MQVKVDYSKQFLKNYLKRISPHNKIEKQFKNRLLLFKNNPQNSVLRDHKLSGSKKDLRSFSITGDIRVIYYKKGNILKFVDIGSHSQVY